MNPDRAGSDDSRRISTTAGQPAGPPAFPMEYERTPPRSGPTLLARLRGMMGWSGAAEARSPAPAPPLREATMPCPRCAALQVPGSAVCAVCGLPFVCDLGTVDYAGAARRRGSWRALLAVALLAFIATGGVLNASGNTEYSGRTQAIVLQLTPAAPDGLLIEGPQGFQLRTRLALGLLKERAPIYYSRIADNVTGIAYQQYSTLELNGRTLSLEGIGALAEPETGQVRVLLSTAFPSGLTELWDGDVFAYAGVLVHELRHIELHASGLAPGGWREEVLCEEAAYDAVKLAGAPGAVLARYELYLADPLARRYQSWYDWYEQ